MHLYLTHTYILCVNSICMVSPLFQLTKARARKSSINQKDKGRAERIQSVGNGKCKPQMTSTGLDEMPKEPQSVWQSIADEQAK